eukprot:Opistho-2@85852
MASPKGKAPADAGDAIGWQDYYSRRCGSMPVAVRHINDVKGRGLFALRDFKEGEDIFTEQPLVSAQFLWNELYGYAACHHCMRSLESPARMAERLSGIKGVRLPFNDRLRDDEGVSFVRCENCEAPFCSAACKTYADAHYHRLLCVKGLCAPDRMAAVALATSERAAAEPSGKDKGSKKGKKAPRMKASETGSVEDPLAALQDAWRLCHYPPENASVMLLARIVASVKQGLNDGLPLQEAMLPFSFFHKSYRDNTRQLSHKLVDEKFEKDIGVLAALFKQALYDERLLPWFTVDGFRTLLALVGMNGQGIGTSSLNVHCRRLQALALDEKERGELDGAIDALYDAIEDVSGDFDECQGSGLYAIQSTCNHSCSPNAVPQFKSGDTTLTMIALRDIAAGEEVCISYLDECERRRKAIVRREHLLENYLFHCDCVRCVAADNGVDESDSDSDSDADSDAGFETNSDDCSDDNEGGEGSHALRDHGTHSGHH